MLLKKMSETEGFRYNLFFLENGVVRMLQKFHKLNYICENELWINSLTKNQAGLILLIV